MFIAQKIPMALGRRAGGSRSPPTTCDKAFMLILYRYSIKCTSTNSENVATRILNECACNARRDIASAVSIGRKHCVADVATDAEPESFQT